VHRGTVFGFTQAEKPKARDLIEVIGWARWIRPIVRRAEREPVGVPAKEAINGNGHIYGHATEAAGLRLRANIKLSNLHDQQRADSLVQEGRPPSLRGKIAHAGSTLNVMELFAGAGGMGLGFLMAESGRSCFRILHSGEVDPIYVNTLNSNHAEVRRIFGFDDRLAKRNAEPVDLRDSAAKRVAEGVAREAGGVHVLIGGPPCQGFSNSNRNSWHSTNPNNRLVDVYLDYVKTLKPKVFVMENVQGISWTHKGGVSQPLSSVLEHVRERMVAAGYEVFVQLLDSVWYGVPQCRSRFFVVGLHRDLGYRAGDFGTWGPFPRPTHGPGTGVPYVTVRDAIGDLPAVENGSSAGATDYAEPDSSALADNWYLRYLREGASAHMVTDHVTSRHADYVIERYRRIPPGGNWESIKDLLTNYSDVGRTHSNIYRRLEWDEPSITIGHYRKSMIVHPMQNRGLSLREAARLQSFPDWFRFAGSSNGGGGGLVHKQQQLANAVSPLVSRAIADLILGL
jgi:DNA-cytosine methyltransferase